MHTKSRNIGVSLWMATLEVSGDDPMNRVATTTQVQVVIFASTATMSTHYDIWYRTFYERM